ncbi:hypothetical protein RYX36_026699, partial [Vicia faba]
VKPQSPLSDSPTFRIIINTINHHLLFANLARVPPSLFPPSNSDSLLPAIHRSHLHHRSSSLNQTPSVKLITSQQHPQASKIRKLFNLSKENDVRKYVNTYRRTFTTKAGKKESKAPKIQRLVTPLTLQRKRARIADKKKRIAKAKSEAADYQKLLASRLKEQRDRRSESLAKKSVKPQSPLSDSPTFRIIINTINHHLLFANLARVPPSLFPPSNSDSLLPAIHRSHLHHRSSSLNQTPSVKLITSQQHPQASKIRKLFNLSKENDVRKYVNTYRRTFTTKAGKKESKAPKIQRLVTPLTLQRKRARIADKKKRIAKAKSEAADYQKLLASRLKERRDRRSESLAKKRSRLSTATKPTATA